MKYNPSQFYYKFLTVELENSIMVMIFYNKELKKYVFPKETILEEIEKTFNVQLCFRNYFSIEFEKVENGLHISISIDGIDRELGFKSFQDIEEPLINQFFK